VQLRSLLFFFTLLAFFFIYFFLAFATKHSLFIPSLSFPHLTLTGGQPGASGAATAVAGPRGT
jgi:hypothetical protein